MRQTLYFHDGQSCQRREHVPRLGRYVGIWWHQPTQLIAFLQPIAHGNNALPVVDSELTHDDLWPIARTEFGSPAEIEYFEIPRGRVLWNKHSLSGVIYHGNETSPKVLKVLAELFGMSRWQSRLDVHYLVGEALELFYASDEVEL
jgi:hypothetical protein